MAKRTRAFKQLLFDHIKSQRKRLETLLNSTLATSEEKKSIKRSDPKSFIKIRVEGLEGPASKLRPFKVALRDVNLGLSTATQMQSLNHSLKANSAWLKEDLEESLNELLQAERNLGAAVGFSQLGKIESAIAQGKALTRHLETKSIRAKVIKHWRNKIDPKLSAQKAADELLGIFRWKSGDDIAHRTLAEWIANAKTKPHGHP